MKERKSRIKLSLKNTLAVIKYEGKFRLYLWRDSHLVFWKKELYSGSKLDPKQWEVVGGSGDMWRKIVKYYMENLQ